MKKLAVVFLIVGLFLFSACATSAPALTPSPTKGYEVSFHAYVQLKAIGAATGSTSPFVSFEGNQIQPAAHVTIKNTDSIPRTFKVEITHYYGDKSYTKEFTLQIEPGRVKTAIMSSNDVPSSAEVGKNYWAGDWGIDYQVTPVN